MIAALKRGGFLVSSLTFFLGLVSQPVLGQMLGETLGTPDKVIITVAMLCAYAVAVGVTTLAWREQSAERSLRSVEESLKRFEDNTALSAEFIPRGPHGSVSDPYAVVTELVQNARQEILILDHRPPKGAARFGPESSLDQEGRETYYQAFDDAISAKVGGRFLRYRRVVQLETGPTSVWDANFNGDKLFSSHCRKVVDLSRADPQFPSAIKTSRVFFPNSSIVIVDGRRVLLELAISGLDGMTTIQGDLVFRDNDGVLTEPLRQLFENIDSQSVTVSEICNA